MDLLAHDPASLPIAETFLSFQGEGKLAGMPSYFVRVSGCNLRCRWCDTPYASWNPEGRRVLVDDLVSEACASGARHVVLTGGEPMLFEACAALGTALRARGMHLTIETAGTIDRPIPCDLISISPKLANSTPAGDPRDPAGAWAARHEARRLKADIIQALLDRHPDRQLKFVVQRREDLGEIEALLGTLRGWVPGDVLLMPEGVTPAAPARAREVVTWCIERGWRYCPRLHLDVFGNTRGT